MAHVQHTGANPSSSSPVTRFAADLGQLRNDAGGKTLAALADQTGVSKSVLSEAFAGRKLPTEATVRKLAEALGGNPNEWAAQRANAAQAVRVTDPIGTQPSSSRKRTSRRYKFGTLIATAGVSALVAAIAATSVTLASVKSAEPVTAAPGLEEVGDGVDPMRTVCRNDAVLAGANEFFASADGASETKVLVEIFYSNQCMAVWGRATRYDAKDAGNTLTIRIYPREDPTSSRSQERSDTDLGSIYTRMLIEPDVDARVCGTASATVGDEIYELENPICV